METTTVKISKRLHQELKRFHPKAIAKSGKVSTFLEFTNQVVEKGLKNK